VSPVTVGEKPYLAPTAAEPAPQLQRPVREQIAAARPPASADSRGEVRSLRGEAAPSQIAKSAPLSSAPTQPTRGSVVYEDTALDASPEPRTPRSLAPSSSAKVPSLNEARLGGLDVPDMAVEIHVYDAVAANRFVFINMNKYSEGDRLKEGPLVEEITPDGAILEHQGQRFLLPRN
jgi:general secretion pathway protein B